MGTMNIARRMSAFLFLLETNGKRMRRPTEMMPNNEEEAQSFRTAERRLEKGPIS
jgi:hypothetical protein